MLCSLNFSLYMTLAMMKRRGGLQVFIMMLPWIKLIEMRMRTHLKYQRRWVPDNVTILLRYFFLFYSIICSSPKKIIMLMRKEYAILLQKFWDLIFIQMKKQVRYFLSWHWCMLIFLSFRRKSEDEEGLMDRCRCASLWWSRSSDEKIKKNHTWIT